jgi:hypothetical protein
MWPWRRRTPPAANRLTRAGCWALIAVLTLGLAGCAGWGAAPRAPHYDTPGTRDLLARIEDANAGLVSGQWIGKVSMTADGTRRTMGRTVWAAAAPGRVRFDARTPFGLPVLSLACDESYLTVMAHDSGQYYRKAIGDGRLGQGFPVDLSCRDLYRLLIGRPPEIEYDDARLEQTAEGQDAIRLARRFRGTVARLFVDRDRGTLAGVEVFDIHGHRRFRALLADQRMVAGFSLPYAIELDSAQDHLSLAVARFVPNPPTAAGLFRIRPPD